MIPVTPARGPEAAGVLCLSARCEKKVLDKRTAVVYSVHKFILKPLRRK